MLNFIAFDFLVITVKRNTSKIPF